jgi:hypothetical protein
MLLGREWRRGGQGDAEGMDHYDMTAASRVSSDVGYETTRDASISITARATLMFPTPLENNRRLSLRLYCS